MTRLTADFRRHLLGRGATDGGPEGCDHFRSGLAEPQFLVDVAEDRRRRGVGAALTAAALRAGRQRGADLATLLASPAGEPLYRRCGFAAVGAYRLLAPPA